MPFETSASTRRVAVIGGGISGLGAAHMLAEHAQVVVYEAEARLGGHARTRLAGKNGDQPVDTGFIVFNYANYQRLTALFDALNVPVAKSDMSFSASLKGGQMEYGLRNLRAVFAQKRNLGSPKFWAMLRDVMRFNARATELARDESLSLRDLLAVLGTGAWFRDYYLLPLSGAIWSTPPEKILDFPAYALVRFFENHALLSHTGQHQWYTVEGGSAEYVRRLGLRLAAQGVDLRLSAPVASVSRVAGKVLVKAQGGPVEIFDDVILATHSDDTLRLLSDARSYEQAALAQVPYQPNRVVLHADASLMPRRRAVWSSWNYTEGPDKTSETIDLTYWMNRLQPIPESDPMFVTLNSTRPIREELIYDECVLRHPVYDTGTLAAQKAVAGFNGRANTWFCGAWMKNGFHEDGLASAADVADAILARDALEVVA